MYIIISFQSPGVEFVFDGKSAFFRGTVTVFSADNLAAWAVGGYKSLSSAFRKCQYCMVTDLGMHKKVLIHFKVFHFRNFDQNYHV